MARQFNKLTAPQIKAAAEPGMYGDGGGLWLRVGPTGAKSWIYRYMLDGKAREMGLGPLHTIGLALARQRAGDQRRLKLDGTDPLVTRRAIREAAKLEAAKAITFKECADQYIAANKFAWKHQKHIDQWSASLANHALPILGALPVGAIETAHITKVLTPIWQTKTETASRVRGRIETVLDYAKVNGWRTGPNPAVWDGHLQSILPKKSKVSKVKHHAALPWKEALPFMTALEKQSGVAAKALGFAILTATRTNETIGARWEEMDLQEATWTIPADRMKMDKEHRVPLPPAAVAILSEAAKLRGEGEFVFPGGKDKQPLSNMALLAVLKRMGRSDLTTHGFRSTFRDWCAETGRPADLAEAALAHAAGGKVVVAYQRGDLLDRRRRLMAEWAAHCDRVVPEDGNVVQMQVEAG